MYKFIIYFVAGPRNDEQKSWHMQGTWAMNIEHGHTQLKFKSQHGNDFKVSK